MRKAIRNQYKALMAMFWKISWHLFFVLMAIGVGSIVYGLYFEKPYLTYGHDVFSVVKPQVQAGEVVPLRVTRCNADNEDHVYEVTRSLISVDNPQLSFLLPDLKVMIKPGCIQSVSLLHRLPEEVTPGRYRIYGSAIIPGRVRVYQVNWKSEEFEVVAKR